MKKWGELTLETTDHVGVPNRDLSIMGAFRGVGLMICLKLRHFKKKKCTDTLNGETWWVKNIWGYTLIP